MNRLKNIIFILFIAIIFIFQTSSLSVFADSSGVFIQKNTLKKDTINKLYPDNYLINLLNDGNLWRWHHKSFPLKVYITENNFPSYFNANIKKAFQTWQNSSNGKVSFQYVNDIKQADIIVYVENFKYSKALGLTEINTDLNKLNKPIKIYLKPYNYNTVYMSNLRFYSVALHEIGHSIGLAHSKNINDIMYPTTSTTNGRISKSDINTLLLLYSIIPDVCDISYGLEYRNKYVTTKDIFGN